MRDFISKTKRNESLRKPSVLSVQRDISTSLSSPIGELRGWGCGIEKKIMLIIKVLQVFLWIWIHKCRSAESPPRQSALLDKTRFQGKPFLYVILKGNCLSGQCFTRQLIVIVKSLVQVYSLTAIVDNFKDFLQ